MYTFDNKDTCTILNVRMARHEWSSHQGGRMMPNLARETFAAHPEVDVVEVVEHAGWYLSYARIDGEMVVVGTANDFAQPSEAVRAFWLAANSRNIHYLRFIDRAELEDETLSCPQCNAQTSGYCPRHQEEELEAEEDERAAFQRESMTALVSLVNVKITALPAEEDPFAMEA